MKFLTWNVDGLCGEGIYERTQKSLSIILAEAPDLIFLQEVIPVTERIFLEGLEAQGYISAADSPQGIGYFTMSLYNPKTIKLRGGGGSRMPYTGEAQSRMVGRV
jgi:exonuclease III